MEKSLFGQNCRGEPVTRYTLSNRNGVSLSVMNHGATLLSLSLPDVHGEWADVVLGHETAAAYNADSANLGAVIGRYANRIRNAQFVLDGQPVQLVANSGRHTLHGGPRGWDSVLWNEGPHCRTNQLEFVHVSPDGDQGFPGQVEVSVCYRLTDDNALHLEYRARTSKPTPINLTHHAYFNLGGHNAGPCLDHLLTLDADTFLPVDDQLIPIGEERPVQGSPFDLRSERPIGDGIAMADEQIRLAGGYDHTFCLRSASGPPLREVARVRHPHSGRGMIVSTTEPGVQLYTGNHLSPRMIGKGGYPYHPFAGFCLETQHYPDSPNQPAFPSTILWPGEEFHSITIYRFLHPENESTGKDLP